MATQLTLENDNLVAIPNAPEKPETAMDYGSCSHCYHFKDHVSNCDCKKTIAKWLETMKSLPRYLVTETPDVSNFKQHIKPGEYYEWTGGAKQFGVCEVCNKQGLRNCSEFDKCSGAKFLIELTPKPSPVSEETVKEIESLENIKELSEETDLSLERFMEDFNKPVIEETLTVSSDAMITHVSSKVEEESEDEPISKVQEIYEKHTGTNMELMYIMTPRENILAAMNEYADQQLSDFKSKIIQEIEKLEFYETVPDYRHACKEIIDLIKSA